MRLPFHDFNFLHFTGTRGSIATNQSLPLERREEDRNPQFTFPLKFKSQAWDVSLINNSRDSKDSEENEYHLQLLTSIYSFAHSSLLGKYLENIVKSSLCVSNISKDCWGRLSDTCCRLVQESINSIVIDPISCCRWVIIIKLIVQYCHPQVARVLNDALNQSEGKTAKKWN